MRNEMASARKSGAPPQRSTSRPPGRGPGGARCRRQIGVAESNRGVSAPPLRPCDRETPRPGGRSRPACLSHGRARRRRNERAHGRSPVRSARESAFRRGDDALTPHIHSTARRSSSSLLLACLSGKQGHRDRSRTSRAALPSAGGARTSGAPGPSRGGWWARSRSRQGASLTLGPRLRRGFSAWTGPSIEPRPAYA